MLEERGVGSVDRLLSGAMPEEDLVELKFRLYDGTDIGPIRYSSASTVAMLKERIVAEWPRGWELLFFLFRDSFLYFVWNPSAVLFFYFYFLYLIWCCLLD